jgi:hypothetical protein
MKRRYLYVLLFAVPAFLAAIIISLLLFGVVAGALWLFVFGDNPWPSSAGNVPVALFLLVCMALWIAFISAAYIAGKRQEARAAINAWHLAASAGATALLVFGIAMHQWSVGNIGARSSGRLCSEFCQCKGFAGSGMPPGDTGEETCSCYDARGGEAVKIPLADITAQQCK